MSGASWERVRPILEDALERPAAERSAFVHSACAGDAELLHEVEQFLGCEEAADRALPTTRWRREVPEDKEATEAADFADPERIGPYRILRRIGEGGMGVVYLAERYDGEYRQQVALKVLASGAPRQKLLRLFRNERQILAQLQHPNIVRLLDGGTENGRIYYVMEYVEGVPITTYIREHGLTLRQRLELLAMVCEAVSYAHRKLIIHRDLKPGNVLVTAEGVPKLLDFGLAKVFQEDDAGARPTLSAPGMLTPAYASPEQVRGEHLGVASDLYSLGVLLYELLTGRNPHVEGEKSPMEVCRTICEEDPAPPSRVCAPGLRRQAAGDIDNIVMMALRKEPERRYRSVEELRQDIERYLGGYVVRASQGTAWYHFRKYVLRHRSWLAAAALAAVATVAAGTAIWWQGRRAQRRFEDVRGLAHAVIFELHDAIANLPGSTPARELLIRRAIEYLEKLAREAGNDAVLAREVAAGYERIGDVQGRLGDSNLGNVREALASYRKAAGILEELAARRQGGPEVRREYLRISDRLASALNDNGQTGAALELAQKNLAAADADLAVARTDYNAIHGVMAADYTLADVLTSLKRYADAIPLRQRAVELTETLAARAPQSDETQRTLALAHKKLGALYGVTGRLADCRAEYDAARAVDEARAARQPDNPRTSLDLSYDYSDLGWVALKSKDYPAALSARERALALREAVLRADPKNVRAALSVAASAQGIANVLMEMGDLSGALGQTQRAIDSYAQLAGPQPSSWELVSRLAEAHAGAAVVYTRMAEQPGAAAADKRRHALQAAAEYEIAVRVYSGLRNRGELPAPGNDRIAELARLIEKWNKVAGGQ